MNSENNIIKMNPNELRESLTKVLSKSMGEIVYISKHNKLVGEIRVYSEIQKKVEELNIARSMLLNNNISF